MVSVSVHGVEKLALAELGSGESKWTNIHIKGKDSTIITLFHECEHIIPTNDHLWWLTLLDQNISSRIGALPRLCTNYPDLEAYELPLDTTNVFPDFDRACFQ